MPKALRKPEEGKLWEKAKWIGHVNVTLSGEEKKAIKDNLLSEEECLQFLIDAATAGYKVSLSYSIPEDVHTATLTGVYQRKPNAGLSMSIRHRDCVVAITALKWCLEVSGVDESWEERFGFVGGSDW